MSYGAPWISLKNRQTLRAPVNPFDKATVVSILPKPIHEVKPTIQPGVFDIPAGSYEKPTLVVVGPSSWWRELDENQPLLEIPQSAIQVADSIVRDYNIAILGCDMGGKVPGLFSIPGEIDLKILQTKYKPFLDAANDKQRAWFLELVQMADVLWSRTNRNPLSITEDMRLAANELGLKDKEWLQNFQNQELIPCKACRTLNHPDVVVCPNCKVIVNPEKFKSMGLAFAQ